MEPEEFKVLHRLHITYNTKTRPAVSLQSLENHIGRLASDILFIPRDRVDALHADYHQLVGEDGIPHLHPAVSLYRTTEEHWFPLVLVVGREPNDCLEMGAYVGAYDFDRAYSAFWTGAYSIFAQINGLELHGFMEMCRMRGSSPIAFADALPITIKASVARKAEVREKATPEAIKGHIDDVFSLQGEKASVRARLNLVILSGLEAKVFCPAVERITDICEEHGILSVQTAFFYGTNYEKIRRKLRGKAASAMRHVFAKWEIYTKA